ncbi:hypothetical protein Ancab_008991 [Ancistrocladus abbreviatus]
MAALASKKLGFAFIFSSSSSADVLYHHLPIGGLHGIKQPIIGNEFLLGNGSFKARRKIIGFDYLQQFKMKRVQDALDKRISALEQLKEREASQPVEAAE